MVWLIVIPGTRIILAVFALPMLVSLVALNYHFVGDVIAGSVLGGIVATYATHLAQLRPNRQASA
jgi:membrane-associated phospholipid phosphatase